MTRDKVAQLDVNSANNMRILSERDLTVNELYYSEQSLDRDCRGI